MKNSKSRPQPPIIKNDEDKPIPVEIIAQAIIDVAAAAKKLKESKLKERAILLLIQDSIEGSCALGTIRAVLDSAANLDKRYIKQ